ncbi:MAG: arabinosyltransferase domain-containing protein [Sciscionella sp.]|nr:arabinosyltransferase domain-containing protein [Sciscionella sp.]
MASSGSARDAIDGSADAPIEPVSDPDGARTARRSWLNLFALVAGLITVLCAVALPLAPVSVHEPTVSWPNNPAAPQSTMLTLNAYTPLGIDARFSCKAIRAAATSSAPTQTPSPSGPSSSVAPGVVLSTVDPRQPEATKVGLLVTTGGNRLTVTSRGAKVLSTALPSADCQYTISGDQKSGLRIDADGRQVGTITPDKMPDIDALVTSASAIAGAGTADLSVRVQVDDQSSSSPTPAKIVLLVLLAAGVVASFLALLLLDRTLARDRLARLTIRLRVVDVAVPAAMVLWLFLAPMTDDDGYYSAMAQNVSHEGYVGNYLQLDNQSFAPFTWFYVFLNRWQAFGLAPVVLRIPALIFGLVTWWAIRRFTARVRWGQPVLDGRWGQRALRVMLAAAFLTWWLALDMGVRPEAIVTMCGALTLVAVAAAIERRRLSLLALAMFFAGAGFVVHPTGFTALAPLAAGLPGCWKLLRANESGDQTTEPNTTEEDGEAVPAKASWPVTTARLLCVLAPGTVASFAAFADGSLRDFLHGQALFLRIQSQSGWFDEFQRYNFLLTDNPMGNYAKRAAVLICILSMVWFVALIAAAKFAKVALPNRFTFVGWTSIAMFLLLWPTPSKWTHHFGSISGIGAAFLALMLVGSIPLAREIVGGRRLPTPVVLLGLGTLALTIGLAAHGPNIWPYSWMLGISHAGSPMTLSTIRLDSLPIWVLVIAIVSGGVYLVLRRRRPAARGYAPAVAFPLVVLLFFALDLVYLLGGFVEGTATTWHTWSPWAAAVRDPLAKQCAAASEVQVLDDQHATPLPAAPGQLGQPPQAQPQNAASTSSGEQSSSSEQTTSGQSQSGQPPQSAFGTGLGWWPASPPPKDGAAKTVFGSLIVRPGITRPSVPETNTGQFSTGWYDVPSDLHGAAVATMISGNTGAGNTLTVQYGKRVGGGVRVLGQRAISDGSDTATWRDTVLDGTGFRNDDPGGDHHNARGAEPTDMSAPAGTDVLRVVAVDGTQGNGGWLAFTAPSLQRPVSLQQYLPASAPVALSWQFSFLFPCQRQPVLADGIAQPAQYAVNWGVGAPIDLARDGAYQPRRGGLYGQALREQSIAQLSARLRDFPTTEHIEVYRFTAPFPADAYTVTATRVTRYGWQQEPDWNAEGPIG